MNRRDFIAASATAIVGGVAAAQAEGVDATPPEGCVIEWDDGTKMEIYFKPPVYWCPERGGWVPISDLVS